VIFDTLADGSLLMTLPNHPDEAPQHLVFSHHIDMLIIHAKLPVVDINP
jgi:hypothetical protein